MGWTIIIVGFMLYVCFCLSTIKYQLKRIINHLNIDDEHKETKILTNEEIEKELNEKV
ncbi:hypothetical protein [Litchfieldia salsa]|uniref:Uncharacterized protein n=1 Tax=Litchfieldia salsa TaxID=930152 RepID=A0A1H0VBZ9_9BACI|nr:hypothetical protein [Litchfieldia salsa]SDP75883.1 hypothetical protein SAMN05216565_106170 [Litchfieldia salsa]